MCGRYLLDVPGSSLAQMFGADDRTGNAQPTWNAAPSQCLPVLALSPRAGSLALQPMAWGLEPAWAAERSRASGAGASRPSRPPINARAETIMEKPTFRAAFEQRRCLVPVSGFYEWAPAGTVSDELAARAGAKPGGKVPHVIRTPDGSPFTLAGIYEVRRDPDAGGDWRLTFAIVTCAASEAISPVHHRMPVVLAGDSADAWLHADASHARELQSLLAPWNDPDQPLQAVPVSTAVNDVGQDHPGLCSAVAAA